MEFWQSLRKRSWIFWLQLFFFGVVSGIAGIILLEMYPLAVDWRATYHLAAENWRAPYGVTLFTNPPWGLALLPHAFLPVRIGNSINLMLHILVLLYAVRHFGGDIRSIALVLTSPFMLDLVRTNNIDWIPLLGLTLDPRWGLILLSVKPQALGGAVLIWWKRQKLRLWFVLPTLLLLLLSFILYGLWFMRSSGLPENSALWNIAPFPLLIPVGLYFLYLAWHHDDLVLAAVATPLLTPYVAPYSLTSVLAVASGKYRREVFIVWIVSWIFFIYQVRRMAMM